MTHNNTQAINENFQSIKTEGGQRTRKIASIFQEAFTEAFTEVKEGTSTVRPFAKDLADNTAQVVKEKGKAAYTSAKEAAQTTATDEKDVITRLALKLQAIVKAIKMTLFGQTEAATSEPVGLVEPATEVTTVTSADSTTI